MARSGIEAGKAFVRMFLDDSEMSARLKGLQSRMRGTAAAMEAVGSQMIIVGTKALLPFIAAMAIFVPFSDRMKEVQAVTGATAEQFSMLEEKAKELGRTTSFTASQVAGAMAELGRAGFDPTQMEQATEHTLNLARATKTELPRAAEIMAQTLSQFNKSAAESQHTADILTATVNSSAQGMEDLAEALKPVAPIAYDAGESLEQTAVAIAILANNGIKGSDAGTALARAYKNLTDPTIRAKVQGLGIAVADAAGNMRPLSAIIADITEKTDSMGNADRLAVFEQLFGRGAKAALKLSAAAGGAFDELTDKIVGWNNAAEETATLMDSGIGGSFRRLMSAVEGVAIEVGSALEGPLGDFSNWLTGTTGAVTNFVREHRTLIRVTAALAAATVALGGTILAIATALRIVIIVLWTYRTALKAAAAAKVILLALSGPKGWVLLAAGLGIAAGAAYGLSKAFESSAEEMRAAKAESDAAAGEMKAAHEQLNALNAEGPPNIAPEGLEQLTDAEQALRKLIVSLAGLRGETERVLRLQAAGNALDALGLLGGDLNKSPIDRVREMIDKAIPPAEQLRRKLLEVEAAFALLDDPLPPNVQTQVRLDVIEQATGAISRIRDLQNEIGLLTGNVTEAGVELRKMAEQGAPPQLLERYRRLLEQRDQLTAQQERERDRERSRERELASLRTRAEQIRNDTRTNDEQVELEIAELERLRDALDPDTGTPLIDEETYRRALQKIHEEQSDQAVADAKAIGDGAFRNATDARSVDGARLITDLINGRTDYSEQQLLALRDIGSLISTQTEVIDRQPRVRRGSA